MRSWFSERRTASTGTAKPTPLPLPFALSICELMPSTRPSASSSGPPELPWLTAASVWIAPVVAKPVSDWIARPVAEMIPTDSERSSPNGLPIATTGAPTRRSVEEPSCERAQAQALGVDLQQGDVRERVEADDPRRHLVVVGEARRRPRRPA